MFRKVFCVVVLLSLSFMKESLAGVVAGFPELTKDDRILIIAPHPDDETIGTGGIIQESLRVGAKVRVVLMTNGENNELAFIVYKKRPVLMPGAILKMGEARRKESVAAMALLGVGEADVISLGYPDFGTMDVFTKFWGSVKRPFRSMLSRKRYVPYADARTAGAPYVGESILKDLEGVIEEFKPTKVFVSHPVDVNRDHRATYLFLKVALWDLEGKIVQPDIFPYLIHVVGWPKPRGYFPELETSVPKDLTKSDILWNTFQLSVPFVDRKEAAVNLYATQNKYDPKYLRAFARRNELFGDYPPVPIIRQMSSDIVWQHIGMGNSRKGSLPADETEQISSLAYARQGNNLLVRVRLRNGIDREMGVSIFLFGYRQDVPFGEMPKINLIVGLDGLHVKNGSHNLLGQEIIFTSNDKDLVFSVPLATLGLPDRILSCAKASMYDLAFDETAWRTLVIQPSIDLLK